MDVTGQRVFPGCVRSGLAAVNAAPARHEPGPIAGIDPAVELVDQLGVARGRTSKSEAHHDGGRLHRAFSVLLMDPDGHVLIQRRAAGKYHSAGLWSNSCCGHPAPGEDPAVAAARRIGEELGGRIDPAQLEPAGTIAYAVADPVSGIVEREFNHLFVGPVPRTIRLNPAEVSEIALVRLDALDATQPAGGFTAWFPLVFGAARPALEKRRGRSRTSRAPDP